MGRNDISPQPFEVTGYDRTAGAHRTDAYRLMILVGITMRWYSSTDKSSYHKRGYAPAVSVINKRKGRSVRQIAVDTKEITHPLRHMLFALQPSQRTPIVSAIPNAIHAVWVYIFPSSIARQPRECQYRYVRLRKALGEMIPTPLFLAPALFQLWGYRPWKIDPGVCDIHTVAYGTLWGCGAVGCAVGGGDSVFLRSYGTGIIRT